MPKPLDLLAQKFGRLVVLERAQNVLRGATKRPRSAWRCQCDCGTIAVVEGSNLKRGITKSCGCLSRESAALRKTTHGCAKRGGRTPEFDIWCGMRQRCSDPSYKSFKHYGGRGIKVCARWGDFVAFLQDMGPRPSPAHSIERNDSNGNYEPNNCRWATHKEQMRNTSRSVFLTHADGTRRTLPEWAEISGLHPNRLRARLYRDGWSLERAISTPLATGSRTRGA